MAKVWFIDVASHGVGPAEAVAVPLHHAAPHGSSIGAFGHLDAGIPLASTTPEMNDRREINRIFVPTPSQKLGVRNVVTDVWGKRRFCSQCYGDQECQSRHCLVAAD
jgi:hypothetical protein